MPDESFGTSTQVAVLEEKINSLRRQLTTAIVMGVLILAAMIGLVANGRSLVGRGSSTIEAQSFVVRDPQGRARAVLQSMGDAGAQLVFFREPMLTETWRSRSMRGPFSFAVRDWRGHAQMLLTATDGPRLDLDPNSVSIGRSVTLAVISASSGGGRVHLVDSTGAYTTISAETMTKFGTDGRARR